MKHSLRAGLRLASRNQDSSVSQTYGHYNRFQRPGLAALAALGTLLTAACASQPPAEPAPQPESRPAQQVQVPKPVEPAPRAPERYVVKMGDTLWDISSMFLKDPWLWPEIWYVNPQIENPHLIYPGDVIILFYQDGRAQLRIEREGETYMTTLPIERLSPKVRVSALDQAIATIPIDAIRPFLSHPRVISEEQYEAAPYVMRSVDGRLLSGAGTQVFVRGITPDDGLRFNIVRLGDEYEDPVSGDEIGWEAMQVGEGVVRRWGDPSTMMLEKSTREVMAGDRLIPVEDDDYNTDFLPHAPDKPTNGYIIDVVDGVSQIGQYQIVTLNLGESDGIEAGHVLAIFQRGEKVRDKTTGRLSRKVMLPDWRAGELIIFRSFERISYGLVLEANSEIHVLDMVRNP